jgi:hypothetical protein
MIALHKQQRTNPPIQVFDNTMALLLHKGVCNIPCDIYYDRLGYSQNECASRPRSVVYV